MDHHTAAPGTSEETRAARTAAAGPGVARTVGVGILGASGYSGIELIRLLGSHPHAAVRAAASRQYAGQPLAGVWPAHPGLDLVLDDDPTDPRAWIDRGVEVVFAALPHGAFAARARAFLGAGIRVVDLSADFRLRDPAEYAHRYGLVHPSPELLELAAYGLTECDDGAIDAARLVANPGCYATAVLLATLPAVAAGVCTDAPIVANALSGVSGAGRGPSLGTHFVEVGASAAPYRVGETHAHLGEMRQALARARRGGGTSADPELLFNPHLVPMGRGIVASVAVPLARPHETEELRALYGARYAGRPFVRILGADGLPDTRNVRGSNRCDLAIRTGAGGRMLLVYAAIDNLVKGAAGQAIQNWNRMQGWPEATGLPFDGWAIS